MKPPPASTDAPPSLSQFGTDSLYRSVLDSADTGFCIIKILRDTGGRAFDYRFLAANPAFLPHAGVANPVGRTVKELLPDVEDEWIQQYANVASSGKPVHYCGLAKQLNRWFDVDAFRIGAPGDDTVAVLFADATDLTHGQKRNELLTKLSRDLAGAATEAEILRIAVTAAGEYIQCDRCYFIECLEKENVIVVSHSFLRGDAPSIEGRYSLYDFGGMDWWHQFVAGDFAVTDVQDNPLTWHKAANYTALGVRSYAVQPYRSEGAWTAALVVAEKEPRLWTAHELSLIEDIVARVWPMVERARATAELQQQTAFFKFLSAVQSELIGPSTEEQMLPAIGSRILHYLQLTRCVFCRVDSGAALVEVFYDERLPGMQSIAGTYDLNEFHTPDELALLAGGRPVVIENIWTGGRTRDAAQRFSDRSVESLVSVPYVTGGKWKFVISAQRSKPHSWSEAEVAGLQEIAERVYLRLDTTRTAEALRQSEARFRTVFESIDEGFCTIDLVYDNAGKAVDYRFIEANPAFEQHTGLKDVVGKTARELVPTLESKWPEIYDRAAASKTPLRFEQGSEAMGRWFNVHVSPLSFRQGRVALVFTDVTEQRKAAADLEEAHRLLGDKAAHLELLVEERTTKLRDTIGELEAFSYSIAHDMRAPLRSLKGFSEVLLEDYASSLDEEGQKYLTRIATAAGRMDKLIQDVLSYSRVVRTEQKLEPVDVRALIESMIETYPPLSPEHADIQVDDAIPTVLGNEALLTQVFSNLLGNAVKFVAPGVRPRISVTAESHGERVILSVSDNGIGVAKDQQQKIFGIFHQVSTAYAGTGIGLAIVKKAVERIGGSLGLRSREGVGSTFWIDVRKA